MNDAPDLVASDAARLEALDAILGPGRDQLYHARIPLVFGGRADVVRYAVAAGVVYVTSGLLMLGVDAPDHEIALCLGEDDRRAPAMMARLGEYAFANPVVAGDTIDLSDVPAGSAIRGLVFDAWTPFTFDGRPCRLLLALGITRAELEFSRIHGSAELLARLHAADIPPVTDFSRSSLI